MWTQSVPTEAKKETDGTSGVKKNTVATEEDEEELKTCMYEHVSVCWSRVSGQENLGRMMS